jgi:hypothetical protein
LGLCLGGSLPKKAVGRAFRRDWITGRPSVKFGTKWLREREREKKMESWHFAIGLGQTYPSMTSMCSQSAPQSWIIARHSSPSLAKSADKIDGATKTIEGLDDPGQ